MRIATPCHEDWDRMDPRAAGRHCAACDRTVVDLADLPVGERRARLAAIARDVGNGAQVCIRSRVDRDGALAGSRRLLTGGMALLLAMTMAGCQGDGPDIGAQSPPSTQVAKTVQVAKTADPAAAGAPAAQLRMDPITEEERTGESSGETGSSSLGEVAMPVETEASPLRVTMGACLVSAPLDPRPPIGSN